jgi:uncharacterized membrane protein YdjX (TVP38/TMEM64 family)
MPGSTGGGWLKLWPLALLAAGLAAFFLAGGSDWLSFDQLRTHRTELLAFVAARPLAAFALFVALYAVCVAFSLPVAALMSISGGFLFGTVLGGAGNVLGATVGAVLVFLAARSALGSSLRRQAGPFVQRLEAGFREDAWSYMLALRLVPVLPFFLVNIVPALLGVPLRIFAIGTLVGIIPGALVYASIGAGLGSVFDRGETFSVKNVLTPEIIIALVGLGVLALLPVAYKRLTRR